MRKKTFIFIIFNVLLYTSIILFTLNYKIIIVSGKSMNPTFQNGQIILADKSFNFSDIETDDIIIFKDFDGHTCIKRVVALSGDKVIQSDGHLYINGVEKYNYNTNFDIQYLIKDNELYVCGDNYHNSIDSREYGPIKFERIECVIFQ